MIPGNGKFIGSARAPPHKFAEIALGNPDFFRILYLFWGGGGRAERGTCGPEKKKSQGLHGANLRLKAEVARHRFASAVADFAE